MNISNYQLGILFSIGTYIPTENRFVIRYKDVHYINSLQPIFNTNPYSQIYKNKIQYVIKSSSQIDIHNILTSNNYSSYNSPVKTIPILSDYKDFLRAYIEIHSSLDYSTRYSNKKSKKNINHFAYAYTVIRYFLKALMIFYMNIVSLQ